MYFNSPSVAVNIAIEAAKWRKLIVIAVRVHACVCEREWVLPSCFLFPSCWNPPVSVLPGQIEVFARSGIIIISLLQRASFCWFRCFFFEVAEKLLRAIWYFSLICAASIASKCQTLVPFSGSRPQESNPNVECIYHHWRTLPQKKNIPGIHPKCFSSYVSTVVTL